MSRAGKNEIPIAHKVTAHLILVLRIVLTESLFIGLRLNSLFACLGKSVSGSRALESMFTAASFSGAISNREESASHFIENAVRQCFAFGYPTVTGNRLPIRFRQGQTIGWFLRWQ